MQKLNSAPETQLSFGWQRVFASLGWRKSYSIFPARDVSCGLCGIWDIRRPARLSHSQDALNFMDGGLEERGCLGWEQTSNALSNSKAQPSAWNASPAPH